jgi:putative transposase
VAITLEAVHAVDALQEAYRRFGKPDIVNTDQGSQFTAQEFVDAVLGNEVKLSMDGRGAWRDNVFVERIWRSVKYERVYLRAYGSVATARTDIAEYIDWYNVERGHSSLDDKTPEQAWLSGLPLLKSLSVILCSRHKIILPRRKYADEEEVSRSGSACYPQRTH